MIIKLSKTANAQTFLLFTCRFNEILFIVLLVFFIEKYTRNSLIIRKTCKNVEKEKKIVSNTDNTDDTNQKIIVIENISDTTSMLTELATKSSSS